MEILLDIGSSNESFYYLDGNNLGAEVGDIVSVRLRGRLLNGLVIAKKKISTINNDETNITLNGSIESTSYGSYIEYELVESDSTGYIETDYFDVSMLTAGTYDFTAEIISSGDEATPEDNTLTREFVISENIYAIDGLYEMEEWMGTGWPGGDDTSDGVRYANYFDFKENSTLSSIAIILDTGCLLYTSPSPRDRTRSRMPSSA